MIYLLMTGSHDQCVVSVYSSLENAQKGGDKFIKKYHYLSIEEWDTDQDDQYPIEIWHKLISKDPSQSFDWTKA